MDGPGLRSPGRRKAVRSGERGPYPSARRLRRDHAGLKRESVRPKWTWPMGLAPDRNRCAGTPAPAAFSVQSHARRAGRFGICIATWNAGLTSPGSVNGLPRWLDRETAGSAVRRRTGQDRRGRNVVAWQEGSRSAPGRRGCLSPAGRGVLRQAIHSVPHGPVARAPRKSGFRSDTDLPHADGENFARGCLRASGNRCRSG